MIRLPDEVHAQRDRGEQHAEVQHVAPRQEQRLAPDDPLELPEGHHGAGERDGADEHAGEHLHLVDRVLDARQGVLRVQVTGDADEHRGGAHEAVQDRHELGHAGHGDPRGEGGTDQCADEDDRDEHLVTGNVRAQRGDDDGQDHPDDPEGVAAARGLLSAQATEAEDEQDPGEEVGDGNETLRHCAFSGLT